MRLRLALPLMILVTGCNSQPDSASAPGRAAGRYAGIGVFDAGRLWAQMAGSPKADGPAARIADDEHVIVVVDSHTGEIRQCGDHSGYCVATNPWSASAVGLPVKLAKHAADLAAEDKMAVEDKAK